MEIRIKATDKHGVTEEITDLYWFEENFVHDFNDERYTFEFIIEKPYNEYGKELT